MMLYSPPKATFVLPNLAEMHLDLPPVPEFDEEVFLSSPFPWDHLSSPDLNALETLTKPTELDHSPFKVATEKTNFLADLTIEPPLTPISARKPHSTLPEGRFPHLENSRMPLSPESPGIQISNELARVEKEIFKETVTAEGSLRIPLPDIPPLSPRPSIFPASMFGIYIADEGFRCDTIARSVIDTLNDEMKWQPFIGAKRSINSWSEEVEGNWESFVEYTSATFEEFIVLKNVAVVDVDEDIDLDIHDPAATVPEDDDNFEHLCEMIRKRKLRAEEPSSIGEYHEVVKRVKWSQKERVTEFMNLRGRTGIELNDEEITGNTLFSFPLQTIV